ncbi:MAG: ABC transporter permease [Clostridium sp.]|nr:ABC transporter permease [Clostridium sp.]
MGLIGILLFAYCARLIHCSKTGKKSLGLNVINAFSRYNFLLKQLVSRDFKTKYKRSVLGVLWSFLNPLLTMSIQYLVFSTLFKSDIPNFAVYLMVGIVFFSFFNEATNMGLMSIVGNASLITKVYIPKYIFPVSRVMSSSINLFISMVPLLLMAIITRAPITPALLILPFSIICTIVFCIGMAFILSSAMVYFRDMQFLWSVLSMLWMYATPIFYPESILPQSLMFLFKMNPMYHFIRFSRTIILDGISPEPQAYLFCLIAAIVPFLLGTAIFKKAQDRFVLNI